MSQQLVWSKNWKISNRKCKINTDLLLKRSWNGPTFSFFLPLVQIERISRSWSRKCDFMWHLLKISSVYVSPIYSSHGVFYHQWRIWCREDGQHQESHPVLCNNCIIRRLEQERAACWQNAGSVHLWFITINKISNSCFIQMLRSELMMWVFRGIWRIKSSRPTLCWRPSGTPRPWGTTTRPDS